MSWGRGFGRILFPEGLVIGFRVGGSWELSLGQEALGVLSFKIRILWLWSVIQGL